MALSMSLCSDTNSFHPNPVPLCFRSRREWNPTVPQRRCRRCRPCHAPSVSDPAAGAAADGAAAPSGTGGRASDPLATGTAAVTPASAGADRGAADWLSLSRAHHRRAAACWANSLAGGLMFAMEFGRPGSVGGLPGLSRSYMAPPRAAALVRRLAVTSGLGRGS